MAVLPRHQKAFFFKNFKTKVYSSKVSLEHLTFILPLPYASRMEIFFLLLATITFS